MAGIKFRRKKLSGSIFAKTKKEAEKALAKIKKAGRRAQIREAPTFAKARGAKFMVVTGQKLK